MYLVVRKEDNLVLDHNSEPYINMDCTIVCPTTGKTFENCNIVYTDKEIPSDIGRFDYCYLSGEFIRYAPIESISYDDNFRIGEILTTIRTDLSSKWLPCNGEVVYNTSPELSKFCEGTTSRIEEKLLPAYTHYSSPMHQSLTSLSCSDSMWVITGYGRVYGDSSNYYPKMWTSLAPSGEWTELVISNDSTARIYCIYYYNDLWVAAGYSGSKQEGYNLVLWTTKDPTGKWKEKIISIEETNITPRDLICVNDLWVLLATRNSGSSNSMSVVWTTTDPTGEWKERIIEYNSQSSNILNDGSKWIVAGRSSSKYIPKLWTATDPTGEWVNSKSFESLGGYSVKLCYDGSTYTMIATNIESASDGGDMHYSCILTSTSIESDWNTTEYEDNTSIYGTTMEDIAYCNGKFVIVGFTGMPSRGCNGKIWWATDPKGQWNSINIDTVDSRICHIHSYGSQWMAIVDNIHFTGKPLIYYNGIFLPSSITEEIPTYIKVKS